MFVDCFTFELLKLLGTKLEVLYATGKEECLGDVHTGALEHVHMCRCSLGVR